MENNKFLINFAKWNKKNKAHNIGIYIDVVILI